MNIQQAKDQIKNAMIAYFSKDEFGKYILPVERQRPVFLMGPPGIGKTAIMEQIAAEMDMPILSYSMTHHTRQSALGLPFISKKNYGGIEYSVSEYTMSEIIASVYDMIEETGKKEGILFLDEVNCVSETLQPIMLQFLQYKVFGKHRVPDGWIVVTAGNPPEYNNSVKEFDIVTWDRLKRVDCEADFDVWEEYAINSGVHQAVISYLQIKKNNFYKVETTVDGKSFVTARGWDDLSKMIILYEKNNIAVDRQLVGQYLQNEKICRDFAAYYDLFKKYKSDYQIEDILEGNAGEKIKNRAKNSRFDEKLSLIGLLFEGITAYINGTMEKHTANMDMADVIRNLRLEMVREKLMPAAAIDRKIDELNKALAVKRKASNLTYEEERRNRVLVSDLLSMREIVSAEDDAVKAYGAMKKKHESNVKNLKSDAEKTKAKAENMFNFLEDVFGDGQEMLITVTEMSINRNCTEFIRKYGCDGYFKHSKILMFHERQLEIDKSLDELKLD